MTEPRQIEPVTFLVGVDSPVTRADTGHPAAGTPVAEVKSFSDYYRNRNEVAVEPTEDQLAFRRYVKGEAAPTQTEFPDDDIPEV